MSHFDYDLQPHPFYERESERSEKEQSQIDKWESKREDEINELPEEEN